MSTRCIADLEFALPSIWGRKVVTVFIGGGTPSLFSAGGDRPAARRRSARACRSRPTRRSRSKRIRERSSAQKFAGFFAAGVNRLSLGVQSFDAAHLAALGRVHDADEARRAAEAALDDLRQRQPRPDVRAAAARRSPTRERDVAAALAFAPPHLSFYHLTLEPNTLFHRHPPPLPDDDTAADIEDAVARDARRAPAIATTRRPRTRARARVPAQPQLLAVRRLPRHRRRRAFEAVVSRPHRAPGALEAAEAVPGAGRRGRRRCRTSTVVTRGDLGFEFMLNALRLTDGVPATLFAERTGYPLAIVSRALDAATRRACSTADPQRAAADAARSPFPERPAASCSSRRSPRRRCPLVCDGSDRDRAMTDVAQRGPRARIAAGRSPRASSPSRSSSASPRPTAPSARGIRSTAPASRARPARPTRTAARGTLARHRRRRQGHHRHRRPSDVARDRRSTPAIVLRAGCDVR